MLRFFEKKTFGKSKRQIYDIEDKNAGRGVRVAEARRRIVRHGDNFDWLRRAFANQEALEVNSRGS